LAQFLVVHGASLTARSDDGQTPLSCAVHQGLLKLVAYFVDQGLDVNAVDSSGMAAWMEDLDDPDMLKLMVDHGARVNAQTKLGRTALMMAAAHSSTDIVQLLIQRGADVNAKDLGGRTAFFFAARRDDYGRYQIAPILVAAGETDAHALARFPDILLPMESDEASVMLAVVTSRYSGWSCLFQRDSIPSDWEPKKPSPTPMHFHIPDIPDSLLSSLYTSTAPSMVFPVITNIPGVVFVRRDEIVSRLKDRDDWSAYYNIGSGGDGYIEMTLPAFDKSHTHALVDVEYICGGTGSHGDLYYLAKTASGWTIKESVPTWMS
jgi:hypothetical protein